MSSRSYASKYDDGAGSAGGKHGEEGAPPAVIDVTDIRVDEATGSSSGAGSMDLDAALRHGHVPRVARIGTRAGFVARRGLRRAPHARRGALLRGLVQRVLRAEGAVVRRAVLQEHAV